MQIGGRHEWVRERAWGSGGMRVLETVWRRWLEAYVCKDGLREWRERASGESRGRERFAHGRE